MPFVAHAGYSNSVVHRLVSEVATTAADSSDSLPVPGCPARRIGIVLFEGFHWSGPGSSPRYQLGEPASHRGQRNQRDLHHQDAVVRRWERAVFVGGSSVDRAFRRAPVPELRRLFIAGGKGSRQAALDEMLLGRMRSGYPGPFRGTSPVRPPSALASALNGFDRTGQSHAGADSGEDYFAVMGECVDAR